MKKKVKEPEKIPTLKADCSRHGRYEYPSHDEQGFHRFHQAPLPCPKCVADPLPFVSTDMYLQHLHCPKEREWQDKTEQAGAPFFKPRLQIAWEQNAVILDCQACQTSIRFRSFTADVKLDGKPGQ